MAFVPERGVTFDTEDNTIPLTADLIDSLFATLSVRLINNPEYRLPGSDQPFQTTIVVHGGAVFVKLLKSRATTRDIDYLGAYTDTLLEAKGLLNPILLVSKEIETIGNEVGLRDMWMNFTGDSIISQIGDWVECDDGEEFNVIDLIGTQSVAQGVILYEDPGLKVYAMEWCWAFCRKLSRFNKKDKGDIVALISYLNHFALPIAQSGDIEGAAVQLWAWIEKSCPLQVEDWRVHNLEGLIKKHILEVANAFAK